MSTQSSGGRHGVGSRHSVIPSTTFFDSINKTEHKRRNRSYAHCLRVWCMFAGTLTGGKWWSKVNPSDGFIRTLVHSHLDLPLLLLVICLDQIFDRYVLEWDLGCFALAMTHHVQPFATTACVLLRVRSLTLCPLNLDGSNASPLRRLIGSLAAMVSTRRDTRPNDFWWMVALRKLLNS